MYLYSWVCCLCNNKNDKRDAVNNNETDINKKYYVEFINVLA